MNRADVIILPGLLWHPHVETSKASDKGCIEAATHGDGVSATTARSLHAYGVCVICSTESANYTQGVLQVEVVFAEFPDPFLA